MCNTRLDARDSFPSGMEDYLSAHGWHFSRKACEYAVSRMKKRDPSGGEPTRLQPWDRAQCEAVLQQHGVSPADFIGYDHVYVMNMARADHWASAIADEAHLALFVKDYITDPDSYAEKAFTRYYADCIGSGKAIPWEDVI